MSQNRQKTLDVSTIATGVVSDRDRGHQVGTSPRDRKTMIRIAGGGSHDPRDLDRQNGLRTALTGVMAIGIDGGGAVLDHAIDGIREDAGNWRTGARGEEASLGLRTRKLAKRKSGAAVESRRIV